jgi:hypothetical protein
MGGLRTGAWVVTRQNICPWRPRHRRDTGAGDVMIDALFSGVYPTRGGSFSTVTGLTSRFDIRNSKFDIR